MLWVQRGGVDESVVQEMVRRGRGLHKALAHVMVQRGIDTAEKARRYFRVYLDELHDPMEMQDMDVGARRLARAINNREQVVIYGDYDVDGVTSVTLLRLFLQRYGINAPYFIPNRFKDGYGLGKRGVDIAINKHRATLLIAVDCGIASVEDAAYIASRGLDLIICDHHLPKKELPGAVAVIDPNRPECRYPFKGLSACGVAFKLAQATSIEMGDDPVEVNDFLDLVALSTVADMMPQMGENRVLVRAGLQILQNQLRPGIVKLALLAGLSSPERMRSGDIGWKIAPRINAAGRMGDAMDAVELLLTEDTITANRYSERLENYNQRRRSISDKLLTLTRKKAEVQLAGQFQHLLLLSGKEWHIGVLGLVAGRLAKEFNRPTLILNVEEGVAKGSGRSVEHLNLDIHDALKSCKDLLINFGGHKAAVGLELKAEDLHELRDRLNKYVKNRVPLAEMIPKAFYDVEVPIRDVDDRFHRIVRLLEPFGQGNEEPVFKSSRLKAVDLWPMSGRKHARFKVRSKKDFHKVVAFNCEDQIDDLERGQRFEMLYSVEENHYRGETSNQLRAHHIRFSK